MIIPYPPGGASDVIARILAPPMTEALGQVLVIENRAGANGGIAAELVARAAPDGQTLLMGNAGPNALNQALYGRRLSYDAVADFTAIALVSSVPLVMAVHPSLPVHNLAELLAHVRAHPGQLNFATGGIGSAPHLTMEQLGSLAGVEWVHVGFRGGQAGLTAVLANQIPMDVDTTTIVLPHVLEGRLRGIAISSARRMANAPNLPTIAEQGFPGFEATSWGGIMGPARMPAPIVQRLHAATAAAMARPEVRAALERQGVEPRISSPEEFAAHIAGEVARWTEVVRRAGVQPE